jgi:ABC-type transport system involved in multi-copper enzyme maturation permease subunit
MSKQAGLRSLTLWESLGAVSLLVFAATLVLTSKRVPLSYQLGLWGVWIVVLAFLFRGGWIRLFGPVLFYDLVRTGRRTRNILLRCFYALALLLMLYTVYSEHAANVENLLRNGNRVYYSSAGPFESAVSLQQLMAKEMAKFAESFFIMFMEVQFIGVFLLTPAFAAGAIAEEKDRRTLEFLLATDLDNREIILGKLVSRLLSLVLLVLTGLPILSLVQFFGGVDPDLVLSGFAATGLTMLSLAGVSILASVYTKKPRDAIVLTYLIVVAYLGLSALGRLLISTPRLAASSVGVSFFDDLLEWFSAGNLFVMVSKLRAAQAKGLLLEQVLPGLIGKYALLHALLAVFTVSWAVVRMRAVAMTESIQRTRKRRQSWWKLRPPVRGKPMLWKEINLESGLGFNRLGRIVVALIMLASFLPAIWIGYHYFFDSNPVKQPWIKVEEAVNQWVRSVGTVVASLVLLGIGIRASGAVSGERDRQTLDSLLTSPLTTKEILFAKWLGSIFSVRWAILWLGIIWTLGALTGGLDRTCLPWLIVAWCVYAGFMAALGLFFSTVHSTTQRASIWMLTVTGLVFGGHWVFSYFFCMLLPSSVFLVSGSPVVWIGDIQTFGMTPPVAMSWLAFRVESFNIGYLQSLVAHRDDALGAFVGIGIGLVIWTGLSWLLWRLTVRRFNLLAGRRKVLVIDKSFAAHYPRFRPVASSQ